MLTSILTWSPILASKLDDDVTDHEDNDLTPTSTLILFFFFTFSLSPV